MEINKMLTISTGHVTATTLGLLEKDPVVNNFPEIGVYEKGDYGFILYLTGEELLDRLDQLPADLAEVVEFSINAGCNVLCLDCDGEEVDELPWYDGDSVVRAPEKPFVRRKVGIQGRGKDVALAVGKAIESYFNTRKAENASDNDIDAELTEFFTPDQLHTVYKAILEDKKNSQEKKPQGNQQKPFFHPEICDSCTNIGKELCLNCIKLGGNADLYAKRPSCEDLNGPCYKCCHCAGWWEDEDIKEYLESVVKEYFQKTIPIRHLDTEGKAHIYMCPHDSFHQTVYNHRYGTEVPDMTLYEEVIHDLQPGIEHYIEDALTKILEVIAADIHDIPYFQKSDVPEDCKLYIRELIHSYTIFEMPSHRMVFLWHILPDKSLWDLMCIEKIMAAGANDNSVMARWVVRDLFRAASKEDQEQYCNERLIIEIWICEMQDLFEVTTAELKYFCAHNPRTVFKTIFEQDCDI